MLHKNLSINEAGHLTLAGMDTVELAKKYGTPLYLMDENRIRENCRTYIDAMRKYMGEGSRPIFASKACCFKRMYAIIAEMGMGTDIVSPGELYTANAAGFPMEKAFFHGNNKTDADIEYAINVGIGYFIVDNREELEAVNACALRHGIRQKILLRLTPGIDPHTQKKISTGKVDSKFGTAIETGQALELCKYALSLTGVELEGFHCHIGSQIFDYYPFRDAAEIMLRFIRTLLDTCGHEIRILNLGGGFGVRYVERDPVVDYESNIRGLAGEIQRICSELSIRQPDILMEPGRSIVADSGMTLYTVGSTKTITGYKSYVSVDGGMTDNIRYALYESDYTALLANRPADTADFCATIAGRCCESGDIIQEDVMLPRPMRGDTLAVLVTGAYNYSMASNYNRIPRPPVVMVRDGEDYVAVRKESYEDLCRNDI
ncbi:MAG: diaminopimelate decarboxylase [Clostridiales bacterium]|jgi:diaminopimelate decarboxylase|nr:diaminopimelate decarboxylase [Clostridiales bacterium]